MKSAQDDTREELTLSDVLLLRVSIRGVLLELELELENTPQPLEESVKMLVKLRMLLRAASEEAIRRRRFDKMLAAGEFLPLCGGDGLLCGRRR